MPEGEFPPAESLESVGLPEGLMSGRVAPIRSGEPYPLSERGLQEYREDPRPFVGSSLPKYVRAPPQEMEPLEIKGTLPAGPSDAERLRQLESDYARTMNMMRETIGAQDLERRTSPRGRSSYESQDIAERLQTSLDEIDREIQHLKNKSKR